MSLLVDTSVCSLTFRRDGHPGVPEMGAMPVAAGGGVQIGTIDALLIRLTQRYDLTLPTADQVFHAASQHVKVRLPTQSNRIQSA